MHNSLIHNSVHNSPHKRVVHKVVAPKPFDTENSDDTTLCTTHPRDELWLVEIDADIVPPPRTCASSFFNLRGNSSFYLLVKDALKNTEGKTFLTCLSIALEVFLSIY